MVNLDDMIHVNSDRSFPVALIHEKRGEKVYQIDPELQQKAEQPQGDDCSSDWLSQSLPLSPELTMYALHGAENYKKHLEY